MELLWSLLLPNWIILGPFGSEITYTGWSVTYPCSRAQCAPRPPTYQHKIMTFYTNICICSEKKVNIYEQYLIFSLSRPTIFITVSKSNWKIPEIVIRGSRHWGAGGHKVASLNLLFKLTNFVFNSIKILFETPEIVKRTNRHSGGADPFGLGRCTQ